MTRSRRFLRPAYAVVAILALVNTWHQNVAYIRPNENWPVGFVLATERFWRDTFANPASTSITVDIAWLTMALSVMMVFEARRLAIRFVWAYIVLGLLIAISFTFPLFLIARERRMAADEAPVDILPSPVDMAGLVGLFALVSFMTFRSFVR